MRWADVDMASGAWTKQAKAASQSPAIYAGPGAAGRDPCTLACGCGVCVPRPWRRRASERAAKSVAFHLQGGRPCWRAAQRSAALTRVDSCVRRGVVTADRSPAWAPTAPHHAEPPAPCFQKTGEGRRARAFLTIRRLFNATPAAVFGGDLSTSLARRRRFSAMAASASAARFAASQASPRRASLLSTWCCRRAQ